MASACFETGKLTRLSAILGSDSAGLTELADRIQRDSAETEAEAIGLSLTDAEIVCVYRALSFVAARMGTQDIEITSGVASVDVAALLGDTTAPAMFD